MNGMPILPERVKFEGRGAGMSNRYLKLFTVLLPTIIIGSFEFIRHGFLMPYLTMEAGNFVIVLVTLVLSYLFSNWMFNLIEANNAKLSAEQSKRAVYEERERLARELHDNIAQILFFPQCEAQDGPYRRSPFRHLGDRQPSAAGDFFNLRQPPDSEVKFQDRLHKWLEEWSLVAGIEVEREIGITDRTFTSSEEMLMFGIIQEAFTNIRKHSGAENARLTLTGTAGSWELTIEDDGIGLERPGSANQYGISMIRKRAGDLQADFNIGKKAGQRHHNPAAFAEGSALDNDDVQGLDCGRSSFCQRSCKKACLLTIPPSGSSAKHPEAARRWLYADNWSPIWC